MGPKGRTRIESVLQLNKVLPVPIEIGADDTDPGSHVSDVLVGDYHMVGDVGGYIVWTIKVTLNDSAYSSIILYKRYSEVEEFRNKLLKKHPKEKNIPRLPPKDTLSVLRLTSQESWLESRRRGLQWFLSNVLLNPVFVEDVKEFILTS